MIVKQNKTVETKVMVIATVIHWQTKNDCTLLSQAIDSLFLLTFPCYIYLTNRPDLFMVCTLSSFEHFMASFLSSIRVQTMKKSGRFVFYNNTKHLSAAEFPLFSFAKLSKLNARALCVANGVIFMVYTVIVHRGQTPRPVFPFAL